MKKITAFILIFTMFYDMLQSQEPDKWIRYENTEYGFVIDFPVKPQTYPQKVETELGEMRMNMFQVDMSGFEKSSNLGYMLNFTMYPDFMADRSIVNLEGFYTAAIEGMMGEGELIEQIVCEVSGLEGRQVKISLENGEVYMESRMVLSGSRFYMIIVYTTPGKKNNTDIVKFFKSFRLI